MIHFPNIWFLMLFSGQSPQQLKKPFMVRPTEPTDQMHDILMIVPEQLLEQMQRQMMDRPLRT